YCFGITGVLSCFDVQTGKQVWKVDTLKDFHASNLFFGASCSPIIERDKVMANVGAKDASIVALRKTDGNVIRTSLDDRASYSSPIAIGQGQLRQVIFLTGQGLLSVYPSDGKLAWRFPLVDLLLESCTTPVKIGDILVAGSITFGSVGLQLVNEV